MNRNDRELNLSFSDKIGEFLINHGETVAVAESVTAGHLQVALSLASNAMDFFQGGITAYNLGQKARHFHVDPIHALASNCVSEKVASRMAKMVAELFSSDWGIAVTGYASPVPEKGIEYLFAYCSIHHRGKEVTNKTLTVEKNSPMEVRIQYTNLILEQFYKVLVK